ncbi:MAG: hypothetical protein JKY20_12985 [Alphaproteobacteria bacterium]|nr:hypothetical protein [Alphaproteobacteria bacterium]
MKRLGVVVLVVLAVLCGLGWLGYYLTHSVDSVRVVYKRWKALDVYVFEEIHPRYRKTDPAALISVQDAVTREIKHQTLVAAIWGAEGAPLEKLPAAITTVAAPPGLNNLDNLAKTERLTIPIDHGYVAVVYILHPPKPTGRLFLYHHGYAGVFAQAAPFIQRALNNGDTVAAFNYPGYGENQYPPSHYKNFGWYAPTWDRILTLAENPIRFYVEPVVVVLNHATKTGRYKFYDIAGFSAGGWTAGLAAAVDGRLRHTYSVSGGYPLYLRAGAEEKQSAPPQYYGPLVRAANYLDQYVLAATGQDRRFTQIFNRFDRCCFRNTLGKLYEPAVRAAVGRVNAGGGFQVLVDETHADHKVSDWALDQIFGDPVFAGSDVNERNKD